MNPVINNLTNSMYSINFSWPVIHRPSSQVLFKSSSSKFPLIIYPNQNLSNYSTVPAIRILDHVGLAKVARFSLSERNQNTNPTPILVQDEEVQQLSKEVEESVEVLKNAAKTRKVSVKEVVNALSVIENAKLDPSNFLQTLGGSESPGRTWRLVFGAEKLLKGGRYFPIKAVQRFDATEKIIENGIYLGSVGCLVFEGKFSWKKRILAFVFELIKIKIGPFNPFVISFKGNDSKEPTTRGPFFTWFYVDEEIAVARGRSGGTAFWVRCK